MMNKHYDNKNVKINYFCIALIILITIVVGTQIQIVSQATRDHMKALNLMKSLRRFRQRYISLNDQTYVCVTAIKQKPIQTDNHLSTKSKLTNLYINGNFSLSSNFVNNPAIYADQLNLLKDDIGVKHYTKQFIYGYKHKQIISQYDDQFTKYVNQKKQFQNFTMGMYLLSTTQQQSNINKQAPQFRTYDNNHLSIQAKQPQNLLHNQHVTYSRSYAHDAIRYAQIDHQSSVLKLTFPLGYQSHQASKAYRVVFNCQQNKHNENTNSTQKIYKNFSTVGVSITNYQLVTNEVIPEQCTSVIEISLIKNSILNLNRNVNVNIFDDHLVGDLQKFCQVSYDSGVHIGQYLLLETQRSVYTNKRTKNRGAAKGVKSQTNNIITNTSNLSIVQQYFLVRIQDIFGENAYKINTKLPWTVKPKNCIILNVPQNRTINYAGQIYFYSNVSVSEQYKIKNNQRDKIYEFQIMYNLATNPYGNYIKTGMDLVCLISSKLSLLFVQKIQMTIGDQFGDDHHQIYFWSSFTKALLRNFYAQDMPLSVKCVQYQMKGDKNNQAKPISSISRTIKMSKNTNNKLKFHQQNENQQHFILNNNNEVISNDSIIVLTLFKDAVIQLHTLTLQQQNNYGKYMFITDEQLQYEQSEAQPNNNIQQKQKQNKQQKTKTMKQVANSKYFITSHKIYKSQTINRNGTKVRVQKMENSFYQNSTNQNAIIIYKGLWRVGDFAKFPRFMLNDNQKITSIVVRYGTAFIRIFDLRKVNRQFFTISASQVSPISQYGPVNRPSKSASTQYKFKWGTFCGGNINKNRQTLIKLKCGQPWYKIVSVTQVSPCSYQIQILTQFLCDKHVIFPSLKQGFSTFNGSLCLPLSSYESLGQDKLRL